MSYQSATSNKPLREWRKEDVQYWLLANGYEELISFFAKLNGRHLVNILNIEEDVKRLGKENEMLGLSLFRDIQKLTAPQGRPPLTQIPSANIDIQTIFHIIHFFINPGLQVLVPEDLVHVGNSLVHSCTQ